MGMFDLFRRPKPGGPEAVRARLEGAMAKRRLRGWNPPLENINALVASGGPRLLADVGGTNARFAWQAAPGAPLEDPRTLACADHPSLEAALRHYLAGLPREAPRVGAIAIANPVAGDQVRMTNHHWSFSIEALRQALGWVRLEVLNDFTALALALFVWLLTLHPAASGRVYAAYGGVYIAVSVLWLWLVDGVLPDRWDLVGASLVLAGVAVIYFAPRNVSL